MTNFSLEVLNPLFLLRGCLLQSLYKWDDLHKGFFIYLLCYFYKEVLCPGTDNGAQVFDWLKRERK